MKNKKWSSFKEQQLLTENFRAWLEESPVDEQEELHEILDPLSQITLLSLAALGSVGAGAVAAGGLSKLGGALGGAVKKAKSWMKDKKIEKQGLELKKWLEGQTGYLEAAEAVKTSMEEITPLQQELSKARATAGKPNVPELTSKVSNLMKSRDAALKTINKLFSEAKAGGLFDDYLNMLLSVGKDLHGELGAEE